MPDDDRAVTDGSKPTTRYTRETVEFARALTFLDAVYAFALTLLVVNIDPPEDASAWSDLGALLASGVGAQLLGFGVSFAVIAVFWRVNHRILSEFRAVTPGVLTANLVAIAFVVLIPFSTQGISDLESADEPLAVAVYAVNISAAVIAQSAVALVGRRDGVVVDPLPRRALLVRLADTMTTPAIFLASIPVAYLADANWARAVWLLLIVVGPVSGTLADRRIARIRLEEAAAASASDGNSRSDMHTRTGKHGRTPGASG